MSFPYAISWSFMVVGCEENELFKNTIKVFKEMRLVGLKLNSTTVANILPDYAKIGDLKLGMDIHQNYFLFISMYL